MGQFGSRTTITSSNLSAVQDPQGNLIISPDNSFGASPLGIAARTQALYGIPNANFNLLPDQPGSAIATGNELPYWQINNTGSITATMQYDDTNQTWAVRIDPSAAGSGDSLALTTRSYLLSDSNISLRQKAFASITKVGTQATSQWNLVMAATYYDHAGNQLSTYNIGTANSGSTWTTINGYTTSGSAAISAAAQYVDIALTLTTTTAVTGTAKVDLTSVLLVTSNPTSGAFLVTQTFTSSGTFTVPTGVQYVDVVALSPGGGGFGGMVYGQNATSVALSGSGNGTSGGPTGYWAMRRNIYVGDVASVSVGIGAGGTGGTARTATKAAGTDTSPIGSNATDSKAGAAGATTFGTYLSITGPAGAFNNPSGAPTGVYGTDDVAGASGGSGGGTAGTGLLHGIAAYVAAPFTTFGTAATAGTAATGSGGAGTSSAGGAAATGTAIAGSGGGGGAGTAKSSSTATTGAVGGAGGSGSGGGAAIRYINGASQTIVATGGNGGNAVANTGAGGGAGGAAVVAASGTANWSSATITLTSGKGGDGATGFLVVAYVA